MDRVREFMGQDVAPPVAVAGQLEQVLLAATAFPSAHAAGPLIERDARVLTKGNSFLAAELRQVGLCLIFADDVDLGASPEQVL